MVRELFVLARQHAPSIIFMDEIDSIGGSRMDSSRGGGDSEVQRTMLELLNQLDGFEPTQNIKVLMATNRIDILDSALLRPGRIDRKIEFPNPKRSRTVAYSENPLAQDEPHERYQPAQNRGQDEGRVWCRVKGRLYRGGHVCAP